MELRLVHGWRLSPYAIPALLATFAALGLLSLTWRAGERRVLRHSRCSSPRPAVWSVFEAAILCAPDLPMKLLLTKFEYVGIVSAPAGVVAVRGALLRAGPVAPRLAGAGGRRSFPSLTLLLAATLERHRWIYESARLVESGLDPGTGRRLRDVVPGLLDLQLPADRGRDVPLPLDPGPAEARLFVGRWSR